LSVLRYYLLYVWFGSLYCIFVFLYHWGLHGSIIYYFVGFIVHLCNYCYFNSTRFVCMFQCAHYAWWAFPKHRRAICGVSAMIHMVAILGHHKWYHRPGFVDTNGSSLPVG
jgi:hypothetical protein